MSRVDLFVGASYFIFVLIKFKDNDLFTRTNDVSTLEFTIGFSVGGKSSFPDSFNFQPDLVYVLILASI